jgi:hypothetical protein
MHERCRLVSSVLGVLLLVGCESTSPTSTGSTSPTRPGTQSQAEEVYNPDGFNLAIVTDISGSMRVADPKGFNREGAQLALALSSVEDNLALIAFNEDVEKVISLHSMRELAYQRAFSAGIDSLKNKGGTNFIEALQEATRQLHYLQTTGQTAVIFLSDGKHDPESEHPRVTEICDNFGKDERRIFTIALGEDTDEALLLEMANKSGGNGYKVTEVEELVSGYLKILGDFYNLFTYDDGDQEGYREITVGQSAKRLIYVLVKADIQSTASLQGSIQRDGAVVEPSAELFRRTPRAGAAFDVMQFDSDLEGKWTCNLDKSAGDVILLSEVPITFRILPDNPGGEYYEGDEIPFALEANCATSDKAAYAAVNTTVTVQRWAGDVSGPTINLRAEQQGARVIFRGTELDVRQLAKGDVEVDELETARFAITLSDEGWTHTKETSLKMLPKSVQSTRPFQVSGDGLDGGNNLSLGQHWLGAVSFNSSLDLRNGTNDDVRVGFVLDDAGLIRTLGAIELSAKQSASVPLVQTRTQPAAGHHTSEVVISGQYTDPNIEVDVTPTTITLDLTVHSVSVGAADQANVPPGFSGNVTFPVTMGIAGTSMNITGQTDAPGAPAGLVVNWPSSFTDSIVLAVTVPALTQAGHYEATFRPSVGSGMEPGSEITLGFDVGASAPTFEATELQTLTINSDTETDADGWVAFPGGIDVVLTHYAELILEVEMADLVNIEDSSKSISNYDIKMEPENLTLKSGEHRQLELKINAANLNAGTYRGTITLVIIHGDDFVETVRDVEVVVEGS